MSFVGKVLIVVQLVMSLCFMAFAGAVFVAHQNWRQRAEDLQSQVDGRDQEMNDLRSDFEAQIDTLTRERDDAQNQANLFQGQNAQLVAQLAEAQDRNNTLEQERRRLEGLAQAKSEEAAFRQEEAATQRIANDTLQQTLGTTVAELREKEDELFGLELVNAQLRERHDALLGENGDLKRILRRNGLPTDPSKIASDDEPPPPVDGIVVAVSKDKTSRTDFVEVSIGSDDGLLKNHQLDVYRPAINGARSKYLGRIRIVYVTNDRAVGQVVQTAKNGIIEEGDNVTTRL